MTWPMCRAPDTVGGGVSIEYTWSRVLVRSNRYVPCSSQIARHLASSPSIVGLSGMLVTGAEGTGGLPVPPKTKIAAEAPREPRSEEHTSELQSLMRISYAVFCLKQQKNNTHR